MLEELYPNEHMYIHASNGQAAIAQVQKLPPDIAFLDIRMPLMNGLEALETCRKLSPSTKWIILSGYADFEYAQKAITLSAYSYLLKPVDLATLKQVVDDIVVLKNQEKEHDNKLFTLDVIRSFNMADQLGSNETAFLPYGTNPYVIYQIYIDEQEKNGSTCSSMIYSAVLMIFVEETYFYFIMRYFSTPTGSFVLSVP